MYYDEADKMEEERLSCRIYTPECESLEVVQQKWGYRGNDYNQTECCRVHRYLREAVKEVWDALEYFRVTAWMDGGSAIGVARHNGTQVPWEWDADIAFLLERREGDVKFPGYPPPVQLFGKQEGEKWVEGITNYMNRQLGFDEKNKTARNEFNKSSAATRPWSFYIVKNSDHCIQYNLHRTTTLSTGSNITAHVDLFGVTRHLETKLVDGVYRESVNYLGCFRNSKYNDEHSYYAFPPAKCQFYDRQVWCPRDIASYLKNYYGDNVMEKGVSHDGFYGNDYEPAAGDMV